MYETVPPPPPSKFNKIQSNLEKRKFDTNIVIIIKTVLFSKTKLQEDGSKKSTAVTHASIRPTHSPSWEEMVTLNIDEKTAEDQSINIFILKQSILI